MITLKNISKIYSKTKIPVKALNNINISFDNKGLTFILGKSGSGKSTLLNLIGLLDEPTTGSVSYNNFNYSNLKEFEKDYIRSNEIGFVFQNFNLINEFTVKDNLSIILDLLSNEEKDKKINEVLKMVDLEDYEDRYPSELSAGQQQRVAIARALIKKPKVILADEPTGNVDSKTAKVILDLFKEISKDILVIVVSHNETDSHIYSDRLLELKDGKIIKDITKVKDYQNKLIINNNEVILPFNRNLLSEELTTLNKTNTTNKTFKHQDPGFMNTINRKNSVNEVNFINKKMNNSFNYSMKLYKKRFLVNILSIFILSFLMSVIIIATFFFNFNLNEQYTDAINNTDIPLVLFKDNKDVINSNKSFNYLYIPDKTINSLNEDGNKAYPIYNVIGFTNLRTYPKPFITNNLPDPLGLAIVDKSYLTEIFSNEDGEIDYIYNQINSPADVYITDYMFYSIKINYLLFNQTTEQIIDKYKEETAISIGAIINTNFEENFNSILGEDGFLKLNELSDSQTNTFYDEVFYKHAIIYSTNKDYISLFSEDFSSIKTDKFDDVSISGGSVVSSYGSFNPEDTVLRFRHQILEENQIIVQINQFNQIFGTNYIHHSQVDLEYYSEIPLTVTIKMFENDIETYFTDTFYIAEVRGYPTEVIYVSPKNNDIRNFVTKPMAVLTSPASAKNYIEKLDAHNLIVFNNSLFVYNQVLGIVSSFTGIFNLIRYVLIFTILIIILVLSINSAKRNKRFIGIMKCFGSRRYDLSKMFFIQTLINISLMTLFIVLGTILGTNLANSILEKGITHFLKIDIRGLNIIKINWITSISYIFIMITIFLLSVIIPILLIKRTNPIEIVKSKE